MSIWDDPEMRIANDYARFENIGDSVSGVVTSITAHRWDDGSVVPKVMLDTASGEIALTAGQVRLKAMLAELRPDIGDTLTVTLMNIEKRAGGKTLKHFDVDVVRGSAPAPTTQKAAKTPEQEAAFELLKESGLSA